MPAQTDLGCRPQDKQAAKERVARAAVIWIYDRSCSEALMELEDAVTDYIGVPIEDPAPRPALPAMGGA